MTFPELLRNAERLATDNSPLILTTIGVAGTITTALLTGKAAVKADRLIGREEMYRGPDTIIMGKEKAQLVWKLYIPPVATGVVTIAAIISANRIGTKRAAALAAAYGVSQEAFIEYREKVVEKLGQARETSVRDEIAQDQVKRNPPVDNQVILTGDGTQLFREAWTGRYFHSTMESVKKAQNSVNYKLNKHWYASLSDFYDYLGIPHTDGSDNIGWNSDHQLEILFSAVFTEDGSKPCISMDYQVKPSPDFTSTK